MRRPSVADALVARERERLAGLTPEERIEEALALGEQAIGLLASRLGVSREDARRALARSRQEGRRPSPAARRS